jgi:hypothetical protein
MEERVVNTILSRIRLRRRLPAHPDPHRIAHSGAARESVKLREATFSDFSGVLELKRRCGLPPDSLQNWERMWRRNPALRQVPSQRPMGWILESEGRPVGYHGNISLSYRYADRTLTAATGVGFAVDPAYRALSLSLVAAFYGQKAVDLYLTTTAIESVGKIARAFKSDPLPQADYETVLFWVLQPYHFTQAVVKKLRLSPALSRLGALAGSLLVGADKVCRRRWPRQNTTGFAFSEINPDQIGDEFQSLWMEKVNEAPRLLADRTPAVLRWHFDIPPDAGTARILCCHKDQSLVGYAAMISEQDPASGLRRSMVADLLVKQDDPEIVSALLGAAYEHAKRMGSHVLEVLGFPAGIRKVCAQWNSYRRSYPACPFYFRAADPALHKTLLNGGAWYATPFDGDTTLSF